MKKDKENIKEEINTSNESKNLEEVNKENKDKNSKQKGEEIENTKEERVEEIEEEKLNEEIRQLKEEKIRVLAEMENLRKRFDREKIDSIKYGSVNLARDVLSPSDNLERALSAINKEQDYPQSIKKLIEGLLMVKKELSAALEKNGISRIDTLNKKFDPKLHQAMMEIENNDFDEGIVIQEIQTGYMMHDRLLRPAMVGVSKKTKNDDEVGVNQDLDLEKKDNEKNPKN
tara:strand:+ start:162 stop:851 length:690 start_codon:yes stop_codon:yes gene_type:complete